MVKQELGALKAERPGVIQAIKETRKEGDLGENAAYDAARERQGMIEAKVSYIESCIPRFNVINLGCLGGETVTFGRSLLDLNIDEEREYTLVGPLLGPLLGTDETGFVLKEKAAISVFSPVAPALLGKEAGDEITVKVPRGQIRYEITDLHFNGGLLLNSIKNLKAPVYSLSAKGFRLTPTAKLALLLLSLYIEST